MLGLTGFTGLAVDPGPFNAARARRPCECAPLTFLTLPPRSWFKRGGPGLGPPFNAFKAFRRKSSLGSLAITGPTHLLMGLLGYINGPDRVH